jgi:hypothetical protein
VTGWTRASELDRVLYCVGSSTVPVTRVVSESTKRAGLWGTFVHYWKETGTLLDTSEFYDSFKKTFDKKWEIIGSDELREELWPSSGCHEVSYSFNCETESVGRYDEPGADKWKQSHSSEWVCGTCDYEGEMEGLLWLDDLKTGALYTTPPDKCLQLYYYSLCASLYKYGEERDVVASITRWPKSPLSVLPDRKFGFIPAKRLVKFKKLLVSAYEVWLDGYDVNSFNPGDQCVFCPVGKANKCPVT